MAQKVQIPPDLIGGDVDEGYGKVADAFRRNLSSGQEVGAAIAVYRDGRKVVDLWGGYRNGNTQARRGNTTPLSTSSRPPKALPPLPLRWPPPAATCPTTPKSPTTGRNSRRPAKTTITVRQLLAHQAGLARRHAALTLQELADPARCRRSSRRRLRHGPRGPGTATTASRSAGTQGELIRRTDPAGRSLRPVLRRRNRRPPGTGLLYRTAGLSRPRSRRAARRIVVHQLLLHLNTMPRGLVLGLCNPFALDRTVARLRQRDHFPGRTSTATSSRRRDARRQRHRHRTRNRQAVRQRRHRRPRSSA